MRSGLGYKPYAQILGNQNDILDSIIRIPEDLSTTTYVASNRKKDSLQQPFEGV